MKKTTALFSTLTALAIVCSIGCSKDDVYYGEVSATEIDVGVKIPGRIGQITVHEGQSVSKGDSLGILESKEIQAKLKTASAGKSEANEQLRLAKSTFERMERLYKSGSITKQQFEEARYKFEASKQKVNATEGMVDEVSVYADEALLRAPIDGEVLQIISSAGELVSPGYPVVTLVDLKDQWVVFNVREDKLSQFKKDQIVQIEIPALQKTFPMKISFISAMGSFAKWKSTNEQGRFDLKTFELRARPETPIADLRPGMTALVKQAQ